MKPSSLVSIIIPTYNRAHLISRTLDSILDQTYSKWECIIVDDGSTDDTKNVVQNFVDKDSRFQYYRRPKSIPKGANACRNYGFELSRGEFINWLDSDDVFLPEKLEVQMVTLHDNQVPYCICQSMWIDQNSGKPLGLRAKNITSENRFEDYILYRIFWSIMAPLWRRNFLINNNLTFNESLHQSQEYEFHIRALAVNSNYIIINQSLVEMFKHDQNLSNNILFDINKIKSNVLVKMQVLENYGDKLSEQTKVKLLEIITIMFKELLLLKQFKAAFFVLRKLLRGVEYIEVNPFDKVLFKNRVFLIYVSYLLLGKGYNILKPLRYA
ncbi:glycosyltransferase family 2 protein [Mangrovimonas aestuarii]|uniref:glycosyltransferase family 2 protein n=1 Tax=Mangrovimonas aestuarii TaxID=3018443 RepID=UPI00237938FE|nr:glycosyltransferase family 2 protein [Mangrovimonas aestuarii]